MRSMLRIEITFHGTGNDHNNNNVKMKIMFEYQQASQCVQLRNKERRKKSSERN